MIKAAAMIALACPSKESMMASQFQNPSQATTESAAFIHMTRLPASVAPAAASCHAIVTRTNRRNTSSLA
jgi:hypothetical protein